MNNEVMNAKKMSKNTKTNQDKPITAWAVEVNGEISPYDVVKTRSFARELRNEIERDWGDTAHVRKIKIEVIKGGR